MTMTENCTPDGSQAAETTSGTRKQRDSEKPLA
jgi:hypothetical protein